MPQTEEEKMRDLGYVTVAEAAKLVKRARMSVYHRARRFPQVHPKRAPFVKASATLWIYRDSLLKAYPDPARAARDTGKAGAA